MLKQPLPNDFSRFYPPYLVGTRGMRKQRKIGIKRRRKTNLKAENRRQMYLTQKDIATRVPVGQVRRDFVSVHQQALFNQLRDKAEDTRREIKQRKQLEIEDRQNQKRLIDLGRRRLIQDGEVAKQQQKQLSIQNAIRVDENKARLREMDAQQHFQQQQLRLASDFMRDISSQLQSSERRQGELEAKVQQGIEALRNRTQQDIPIQFFKKPKPIGETPAPTLQRQRSSEVQQELALQRSISSALSQQSSTGSAYGVKPKRRPQAPTEDPNIVALRRRRQEETQRELGGIGRLIPPQGFNQEPSMTEAEQQEIRDKIYSGLVGGAGKLKSTSTGGSATPRTKAEIGFLHQGLEQVSLEPEPEEEEISPSVAKLRGAKALDQQIRAESFELTPRTKKERYTTGTGNLPSPPPPNLPVATAFKRGLGRGQAKDTLEDEAIEVEDIKLQPVQPLLQEAVGAGVFPQEEEVVEQGLSRKDVDDRLGAYERLVNLNRTGGLTARGGRTAKTDVFFEITEDLPQNWYFGNRGNIPNKKGKYKLINYGDGSKTGNTKAFGFTHNRDFFTPKGDAGQFNLQLYDESRDQAFRQAIAEGKIKFSGDIPE